MKKLLFILVLICSLQVSATWIPYGPDNIIALNIAFNINNHNHIAICHSEGIYIYDYQDDSWANFESNLPVLSAHYLDGFKSLLIMGGGSNSDGIYTFNPDSGQFNLVEFLDFPNFLYYDWDDQKYFVGHRFGLHASTDGMTWTAVDTFNNKNIVSMDSYQDHYVLTEMDNLYATFISDNSGETWTQSTTFNMYSCVKFDGFGKLYGVFPDESWSSGLYSSTDFGETWDVEFWSVNINCLGFDAMSNVFVGWKENPHSLGEGIAWFDQENDSLVYVNDGLTNLKINEIILNPAMSAIALFCCTDTGAFVRYNPTGKYDIQSGKNEQLRIYPNPAKNVITIDYSDIPITTDSEIKIIDLNGREIKSLVLKEGRGTIQTKLNCSPGVYYTILRNKRKDISQKFIVH